MGTYVNPTNETKESFLTREGEFFPSAPIFEEIPDNKLLVCLIDNGFFTAAGLLYSKNEYSAFTDRADKRNKMFFLVEKSKLIGVIPITDLYLLENKKES